MFSFLCNKRYVDRFFLVLSACSHIREVVVKHVSVGVERVLINPIHVYGNS